MRYIIEIAICTVLCSIIFFICDSKYSYRRIMKPIITGIIILFGTIIGVTYYFEEPQFYLIGDQVIELEVKKKYEEKGAKAKYHMKNISSKIETSGDVDSNKVGNYTVEYVLNYQDWKEMRLYREVHVVDTTPPVITLEGEEEITISKIELYQEAGYSAEDNYDGDMTEKVKVNTQKVAENQYKNVYTVTDSANNTVQKERIIHIKDLVKPVITLNGEAEETLSLGEKYIEKKAIVKDDCDGDISDRLQITGNVDINVIGTYLVSYTVSDAAGNTETVTRTVKVVDSE